MACTSPRLGLVRQQLPVLRTICYDDRQLEIHDASGLDAVPQEETMTSQEPRTCRCPHCHQDDEHPERALHHQMNLFLGRLDEQQRRWYAALEANRIGYGGTRLVSQITGLDEKTIRRGRAELASSLEERPRDRVRLPGGGRPRLEKKIR